MSPIFIGAHENPDHKQKKLNTKGQTIFQNEFMKSSFLPKYEQKIVCISALCFQGTNLDNFLFVFWETR